MPFQTLCPGLPVQGHLWKSQNNWGYRTYQSTDDLRAGYRQLMVKLHPLVAKGIRVEDVVLPDEVHDALLWRSWVRTAKAAADFFEQTLKPQLR